MKPNACFASLSLLLLAATTACAPPVGEEAADVAEVQIEEIPVSTDSDAARRLFEEGQYLLDVGRGLEAREKFKAAIAEDPEFVYAHFNQSNASLSFQEFQQCLDRAAEHLDGVSDGERLLVEINRTFLTNDTERGVELARQLTASYPQSPRAWQTLAGLQAGQNQAEAARESYGRVLALDPEHPGALYSLANHYLFSEPKQFDQAEETARRMIAAYPEEAKGYELLGDIERGQKDLEGALAAYEQATDKDPSLAVAQLKKGHVASFLGQIDQARAAYDAGVDNAEPENKASYANYRAFTHIHAGDVEGSLDELEQVASQVEALGTPAGQVKGITVFTLTNLATAALHAGLLDRAAEAVERRNELQMAIAEDVGTDDARRLQEANCHVWDGLVAAYRGDAEEAAGHAEKYAELVADDDNPRKMEPYHWVLGLSALKQGDPAAAVEHLRQADHRNTMFIRYHLALAEEGAGNGDEAKRLFKEVAEWNFNSVGFALVHEDAARRSA